MKRLTRPEPGGQASCTSDLTTAAQAGHSTTAYGTQRSMQRRSLGRHLAKNSAIRFHLELDQTKRSRDRPHTSSPPTASHDAETGPR